MRHSQGGELQIFAEPALSHAQQAGRVADKRSGSVPNSLQRRLKNRLNYAILITLRYRVVRSEKNTLTRLCSSLE